jgi:hypothetical protein
MIGVNAQYVGRVVVSRNRAPRAPAARLASVKTPSPRRGVFRWAWQHAREYRARFWVSAAAFSALLSAGGAVIVLPPSPTLVQKLLAAAAAIAAATVVTGISSYACALVAAPFQQRNALSAQLAASEATVAQLEAAPAAPVSQEHAARLRQVATGLQQCVSVPFEPLTYGEDNQTWHQAFGEHFPAIGLILDRIEDACRARAKFRERLDAEAGSAGLRVKPWYYDRFANELAGAIEQRAMTGILGQLFLFRWQPHGSSWWLDQPGAGGLEIFEIQPGADAAELQKKLEDFMRTAESWPEAAAIRTDWDLRNELCELAGPMLATVANTDPITSRCSLCSGA